MYFACQSRKISQLSGILPQAYQQLYSPPTSSLQQDALIVTNLQQTNNAIDHDADPDAHRTNIYNLLAPSACDQHGVDDTGVHKR